MFLHVPSPCISPSYLSLILCQITKFYPHHVLHRQIARQDKTKITIFKKLILLMNHRTISFWGLGCSRFFLCFQLLVLSDKFGKNGLTEQAVVSKLAKELIVKPLEDCRE